MNGKSIKKCLSVILAFAAGIAAVCCTGCSPEQRYAKSVGSFYSLDEAYENGWLTQTDLKNIAYYFHTQGGDAERVDETFTPSPKSPEMLDEDTQNKLRRTYLDEVIDMPEGSFTRVFLSDYYGTYNACVAVNITDDYHAYDYVIEAEHSVGGVCFYNYAAAFIQIWRAKTEN